MFTFLTEIHFKDEDSALVKKAAAGDHDAFEQLVRKYDKLIYNTAFQITGNAEDAFDISQETFIKVYKSLNAFRGDCKFSTWIYRVCQNTAKDFIRVKSRRPTVSLSEYDENDEEKQLDIPDDSASVQPEEAYERTERKNAVHAALRSLTEDHRNVIVLRDIEGYSYDEISEMLSIEIGTVKSRLNRARLAVKDFLVKRNLL